MNCPKCDADISDTYESDDPDEIIERDAEMQKDRMTLDDIRKNLTQGNKLCR